MECQKVKKVVECQKKWKKLIDFGPMAPSKGTLKTTGTPKTGPNFEIFRGRLADFQRGKMAHLRSRRAPNRGPLGFDP